MPPGRPRRTCRTRTWRAFLRFGRGEVDGAAVVYIITELAEEALAQIIPERPLTDAEAEEMMGPVLDALAYLHGNVVLCMGSIKPSNVLVIENDVKLSSDGPIAAGSAAPELLGSDAHHAPETATGPVAPSADIWSLGMTVVEALTQQLPVWDSAGKTEPVVPTTLPKPFAAIARECLYVDPAGRCSVSEIRAMLDGRPKTTTLNSPAAVEMPCSHCEETDTRKRMPVVPLIVGVVLLIAIIIGLGIHSRKTQTAPVQTETTQQAPSAEPDTKSATPQPSAAPSSSMTGTSRGEVLNRVVPEASRGASNSIQGKVGVAVRVTVDESGAVTGAEFATHGPSAYFARLAMESARNLEIQAAARRMDGRREARGCCTTRSGEAARMSIRSKPNLDDWEIRFAQAKMICNLMVAYH